MRVKLKSVWVRKLIGKLGVPYNRRLGVRGSPHPQSSCRLFINPRCGKQRLTRPFALCEAGIGNGLVYGLPLAQDKPERDSGRIHLVFGQFWTASFGFFRHKNNYSITKINLALNVFRYYSYCK